MNTFTILVAMKPLRGTYAQNVLVYGTGALNIDGARVGTAAWDAKAMNRCNSPGSARHKGGQPPIGTFEIAPYGDLDTTQGRFPANIVLQDKPEVLRPFPQSDHPRGNVKPTKHTGGSLFWQLSSRGDGQYDHCNDQGSASRFYKQFNGNPT